MGRKIKQLRRSRRASQLSASARRARREQVGRYPGDANVVQEMVQETIADSNISVATANLTTTANIDDVDGT